MKLSSDYRQLIIQPIITLSKWDLFDSLRAKRIQLQLNLIELQLFNKTELHIYYRVLIKGALH